MTRLQSMATNYIRVHCGCLECKGVISLTPNEKKLINRYHLIVISPKCRSPRLKELRRSPLEWLIVTRPGDFYLYASDR